MVVVSVCTSVYQKIVLFSEDHLRASVVSTIENPESLLVGGCFDTKPMYFSICAKVSVLYREVRRS